MGEIVNREYDKGLKITKSEEEKKSNQNKKCNKTVKSTLISPKKRKI